MSSSCSSRSAATGLALLLSLAAACSKPAAPPVLSASAYGPVRFGMPLAELEGKSGLVAEPLGEMDPACAYVRFATLPGLRFMVERGVVTRAEAETGVPNAVDVAIGATLEKVRKQHPAVLVQPHKYDPDGHYLIFKSPDGASAIVVEEAGGVVTKIRAGVEPSVSYVEGCA